RDRVLCDADALELLERRREQPVDELAVELRDDDADAAARAARLTLEQVDVVRHLQLAGRVLVRDAQLQLVARVLGLRLIRLDRAVLVLVLGRFLAGPDALAHSPSGSNFSPWWWSRCPSLSRFAARYRRFSSLGGTSIGTCSTTSSPYAWSPETFFGLF